MYEEILKLNKKITLDTYQEFKDSIKDSPYAEFFYCEYVITTSNYNNIFKYQSYSNLFKAWFEDRNVEVYQLCYKFKEHNMYWNIIPIAENYIIVKINTNGLTNLEVWDLNELRKWLKEKEY